MQSSEERPWLNEDFKSSKSAVTLCLKDLSREEDLPAESVLQIQAVTNVSVPLKSQSESRTEFDPKHHILKISLTDGKDTVYAILYEPHNKISAETPPGTKLQALRNIPFGSSRILKLTRSNVEVLGGYVEKLVEHWRVQKDHDRKSAWGKLITNAGDEGPPKFKALNPYGRSTVLGNAALRNAKAMDLLDEVKSKSEQTQATSESKTEFDLQRQEAISDLAKQASAAKKTFSVSKQFPQSEPAASAPAPRPKRFERAANPFQKSNEDPGQEPKHRFQNRKSKYEEEQLLSEYSYRGGQHSLTEHFSSFFGHGQSNHKAPTALDEFPNAAPDHYHRNFQENLSSEFGRLDIRDEDSRGQFSSSQTFFRGGGRGRGGNGDFRGSKFEGFREPSRDNGFQDFRGQGHRGRSRGQRGRGGRGRGRGYGDFRQDPPPRSSPAFVPDLSSFPTLGVDAHFIQKH